MLYKRKSELNKNSAQFPHTWRMFHLSLWDNEWQERSMQSWDRCKAKSRDRTEIPQNTRVSGWWHHRRKQLLGSRKPRTRSPPQCRWRWKAACVSWPAAWRQCRLHLHRPIQCARGPCPSARDPGNLKWKQTHSAVPSRAKHSPLT